MKQICPIHRFSYNGKKCPFCDQERLDKLAQRYVVVDKSDVVGNVNIQEHYNNPITEEDLKKLTDKFNVKKK
jgi:hypothetical protein